MTIFNRSVDLKGIRFGKLTALRQDHKDAARQIVWECKCDCGRVHYSPAGQLRSGVVLSCGCSRATHGHTRGEGVSPTYKSWNSMRQRCENKSDPSYERYGGRGITVCARWASFENFLSDMGQRPQGKTLDRIDVNGNYEPSNCKWATPTQQQRNRRDARNVTAKGKTLSIHEWAALLGTSAQAIAWRLKQGMTAEEAVTNPIRHKRK